MFGIAVDEPLLIAALAGREFESNPPRWLIPAQGEVKGVFEFLSSGLHCETLPH